MKIRKLFAAVLPALLLCALTGCGSDAQNTDTAAKPAFVLASDSEFETAQMTFSLNLLRGCISAAPDKNVLVSPYSAMQVLGMTANGAAGNTRTEMEQVLGGISADRLSGYLARQRKSLTKQGGSQFRSTNSLWIREQADGMKLRRKFLKCTADDYGAESFILPFDEAARLKINGWCSDHTDGMIPEMLSEPISEDAVMFLLNAALFDAEWQEKYKEKPEEYLFYANAGKPNSRCQNVMMMRSDETQYLSDGKASGFLKNYKGGAFAFAAILPENGTTPEKYLAQTDADALHKMLCNPRTTTVHAALPEFTLNASADLAPVLQDMGMKDAFDMAADFSGMTEEPASLFLSAVQQKTRIEVGLNGTTAAALTEAEIASGIDPDTEDVFLNRPFIYLIVDTDTMLPVFAGVLNEIPEAE